MPEPRSLPGKDQPEARPGKRQPAFSLAPPPPRTLAPPSFDDPGGELPPAAGGNRFVVIARDPRSLFVYWELALPIRRIPGARLAIAVHRAGGAHETTCPLEASSGTRFLTVAGPGTFYHLTLGYLPAGAFSRDDMVLVLAAREVATPRDQPVPPAARPLPGSHHGPSDENSGEIHARLFPKRAGGASSGS